MSDESRRRFAAVARSQPVDLASACLLLASEAEPGLDVDAGLRLLDDLATEARPHVPRVGTAHEIADGLRVALGERAGFSGTADDQDDLRSSLLHEVLARRRGLPILLSVVWIEVGRRLGAPVYGIGLPGRYVCGVGAPDGDYVVVDTYAAGRLLSPHDAADRVRRAGMAFTRGHLRPTPDVDTLLRVLTNIRLLAARHDDPRTRLWATDLSLLLPRHPVGLRRERGELLIRLGAFPEGAAELDEYAAAVDSAEPAAAEAARRGARMARARLN